MSDGAHSGVGAGRALGTILGGDPQPAESEMRTPDEMRVWLLACPDEETGDDYEWAARLTAKRALEAIEADPELRTVPMESTYDWGDPPDHHNKPTITVRGLHDVLKERGVEFVPGITGFQWGWAYNAAHYCLGDPPQPNPALVEVDTGND